jgi:serine/threonine-protein kinase
MTEDLSRGSRLGKYELLLRIGRGGMATVWVALEHAEKEDDRRLVAIKAILADLASDPEFKKMFLDEGRLVQSIAHDNVVNVYEVGEKSGFMFLAMEWVEGDSLHALIAEAGKRKPIPPEMAVRIVADAAAGLHAAHETTDEHGQKLGVVHRDVSPHNILIGTAGQIKLVDFGVAKAMGRITEATSAGQLKGKFGYMSPEQAMARSVDRRSDVFSLGIVLFELTTGRRLFRGEHDAETLHLVVSGEIPKPTKIEKGYPERLEQIVLKALDRDPSKRYQTAEAFKKELEAFLKEERTVVPRAGIAALLKRVLGARIEQRRQAVRVALEASSGAGGAAEPNSLISADAAFGGPASDHLIAGAGSAPGAQSHSGVSAVTERSSSGVSTSGISQPSSATGPQTMSGALIPRRGTMSGYVIGLAGLVVALGIILFFAFSPRRTTYNVVPVAAQPESKPPAPERVAIDEGPPPVSLDQLGAVADAGATKHSRPAAPRSQKTDTKKSAAPPPPPAEKPAPAITSTPPSDLPRSNPYEN